VLFIGEMLTASAMAFFQDELAKAIVLATFIPLIISSGGNSGSQAATLIIRSLALGEISIRDWWNVMRREIISGFALGGMLGIIGVLRVVLWAMIFGQLTIQWIFIGITVGISLIGIVLFGTLAGAMLPLLLKHWGLDPATSSAPFVATLVDVTGIVIYFSVGIAASLWHSALKKATPPSLTTPFARDTRNANHLNSTFSLSAQARQTLPQPSI